MKYFYLTVFLAGLTLFFSLSQVKAEEQQRVSQSLVSRDGKSSWARNCVVSLSDGSLGNCTPWDGPYDLIKFNLDPNGFSGYGSYSYTDSNSNQKIDQSLVSLDGKTSWGRSCSLDPQTGNLSSCSSFTDKKTDLTKLNLDPNGILSYGAYKFTDNNGNQKVSQSLISHDGKKTWGRTCTINPSNGNPEDCSAWGGPYDLAAFKLDPNGFSSYEAYTFIDSSGTQKINQSFISLDGKSSWGRTCNIKSDDGSLNNCTPWGGPYDLLGFKLDPNGFLSYGVYSYTGSFLQPTPTPLPSSPSSKKISKIKINNQEFNNPTDAVNFHLPEGTQYPVDLPFEITFDDNTKKFLVIRFNYQPPLPTSTPTLPPVQFLKSIIKLDPDKRSMGTTGGYKKDDEVTITFEASGGSSQGTIHTALAEGALSYDEVIKKFGEKAWADGYKGFSFSGGTRKAKVPFYLEYLAEDGADKNKKEETQKLSLGLDTTPPQSSISLSKTSGFIEDEEITINISATDSGSGAKVIHTGLWEGVKDLDEAGKKHGTENLDKPPFYKGFSAEGGIRTAKVPFYLEVNAVDNNGNKETAQKISITSSSTAPSTVKSKPQVILDQFTDEVYRIYKDTDLLTSYLALVEKWKNTEAVPDTLTKFAPREPDIMAAAGQIAQFTGLYLYQYDRFHNEEDLNKARRNIEALIDTYSQWKNFWQTPGTMYYLSYNMWWAWPHFDELTQKKFEDIIVQEADFWVNVTKEIKKNPGGVTVPVEVGRGRAIWDGCHYKKDSSGNPVTLKDNQGKEVLDTDGNPFLEIDDNPIFCPAKGNNSGGCKLYRNQNNAVFCEASNLSVITTDPTRNFHLYDTRAEESGWNSEILSIAYNMFPTHPNAQKWNDAGRFFAFHTHSKGETDDILGYGVTTRTINDDGLLGNHSKAPHPGYTRASVGEILLSQTNYLLGGNPIPKEYTHNLEGGTDSLVWKRNIMFCMRATDPDNPDFRMKDMGVRNDEQYVSRSLGTVCPYGLDWGDKDVSAPYHYAAWAVINNDLRAEKLFQKNIAFAYSNDKLEELRKRPTVSSIDFMDKSGSNITRKQWEGDKYIPDLAAKYYALSHYNDQEFRKTHFPTNLSVATTAMAVSSTLSVTSIKVENQNLDFQEGKLLNVHLDKPISQEFIYLPLEINYSNGSKKFSTIKFVFKPKAAAALPTSTLNQVQVTPKMEESNKSDQYDLNNDGKINSIDISIFNAELKKNKEQRVKDIDFNKDGTVNIFDFGLLIKNISL